MRQSAWRTGDRCCRLGRPACRGRWGTTLGLLSQMVAGTETDLTLIWPVFVCDLTQVWPESPSQTHTNTHTHTHTHTQNRHYLHTHTHTHTHTPTHTHTHTQHTHYRSHTPRA